MAKFRNTKNSFIAGQISPTSFGRTDLPNYIHACKTLKNVIPMLSGGAYRRPGTKYEDTLDATVEYAPRLIPFVYSKTEAYCLYLGKTIGGNGFVYGYRTTSNISTPTTITCSGTLPYQSPTTNTTATLGTSYDEWHDVQYVQSADILYLVHGNYKPLRVSRTAADTFAITEFDASLTGASFRDAWPYLAQNLDTTHTLAINTKTVGTGRTVTASWNFFSPSHVGAVFKSFDGGTGVYGCFRITGYTNATTVTVEVMVELGTTVGVSTWYESAWSNYRGWPCSVGFFQQRLVYGGTTYNPDSLWFSETSDYNQLSHQKIIDYATTPATPAETAYGVVDPRSSPNGSMAFTLELSSQQLNKIRWISAEKTMLVGTTGDEFMIDQEPNSNSGFGCDTVIAINQSHFGSDLHPAVRSGRELIFARASGDELTSLIFNEIEQAYVEESIQLFFDEYPKIDGARGNRRYRSFAWDGSRKVLWCNDTAGNLFGMTRDKRLQVTAWHTHELGGYDETLTGGGVGSGLDASIDPAYASCSGSVISIAVVPNTTIGTDDLWLAVKREVDGAYQYHIERMIGKGTPYETSTSDLQSGPGLYLVDAAVYGANKAPATEDFIVSGLDHLEGKVPTGTAFDLARDYGIFTITGSAVSSGDTTVQKPRPTLYSSSAYYVIFGLGFSSIIEPVRVEAGSQIGSSQGAVKRIHEAAFRFYRTLSAKVGSDADHLETIVFREGSTNIGSSAELFTGDKIVKLTADYDRDGYVYVLQDEPLPFCLLGITTTGLTYD